MANIRGFRDMNARLQFIRQPERNYGYRYRSDRETRVLKADGDPSKGPAVKLTFTKLNNMSNNPIEIVCQLVKRYGGDQRYLASINTLQPHGESTRLAPTIATMSCVDRVNKTYEFELANYCIAKTKKEDAERYLREMKPLLFFGLVQLPSVELVVKTFGKYEHINLAFTAYIKNGNERLQIANTLYSQDIWNGTAFNGINVCCNPHIPYRGKVGIHLLLTNVQEDYKIGIGRDDGGWAAELTAPMQDKKNLKDAHKLLVYEAPKYTGNDVATAETSVNCQLKLYNSRGQQVGPQVDIVYVRYALTAASELSDDENMLDEFDFDHDMTDYLNISDVAQNLTGADVYAMAFPQDQEQQQPSVNGDNNRTMQQRGWNYIIRALRTGGQFAANWTEIMRINSVYMRWRNCRTTIFHETIKVGQLQALRRVFESIERHADAPEYFRHLALLQDGLNRTLLHIMAARTGRCDEHAAWLVSKCAPYSQTLQNVEGATFLHIAVDGQRIDLLDTIFARLPAQQMVRLLSKYDISGHTALHAAIVKGRTQSVRWLLDCYRRLDVNACEVRTLGMGATPLHLSLQSSQRKVYEQLILSAYKDANEYANYSGYNAYNQYLGEKEKGPAVVYSSDEIDSDAVSDDGDDHSLQHGMERVARDAMRMLPARF